MRQRAQQQGMVGEAVPERGLERFGQRRAVDLLRGGAQMMLSNRRSHRVACGHFQNSHSSAEPSVEKNRISARPTRFSAGMNPTTPRLSSELSRLSPIPK